jgi:hypothetical protein
MLAHDRSVLDVPLEERLQSRSSDLLAWAKTMLPVINRSVRDARAQLQTGHQDLRSYFPQATVATTDQRAATPTVRDARVQLQTGHQDLRSYFSQATVATTDHRAATPTVTSPARPNVPLLDIRQRFQSARTRMTTLSSDIRQYFPGIAGSTTYIHRTSTNNLVHELTNLRTGRGVILAAGPGRTFPILE